MLVHHHMMVFRWLAYLAVLFAFQVVSAARIRSTLPAVEAWVFDGAPAWPALAEARPEPWSDYIPREQTNAARMQRGDKLAKPVKLYAPQEVHSALKARMSPAPQTATTGSKTYNLVGCYSTLVGATDRGTVSSSSISTQTVVNICAAAANNAGSDQVQVLQTSSTTWKCYTGGTSSTAQETCTSSDYAYYAVQ